MVCSDNLLLIALAILNFVGLNHGAIPDYIKICSRKDPDINNCIIDSIYRLRPYLAKGIPELDVPAIEPFVLPRLQFNIGNGQKPVNLTNIKAWGTSAFKITDLKSKIGKSKAHFRYQVEIPDVKLTGEYEIDTKLLFLELKGKGDFHINISNYAFDCLMSGNKVQEGSSAHIVFEPFTCVLNIERVRMQMDNLFGGNELAGRATNEAINDNIQIFIDEIKPSLTDSIVRTFTEISNRVTRSFEYSELFPV